MLVGVLVALGSSVHEPSVLTAVEQAPFRIVRRCVDVADLLATAASRQAEVALISAELPGLDAEVVDRVRTDGVAVVGVVAGSTSADEALLRALGVDSVVSADDLGTLVELLTTVGGARNDNGHSAPPSATEAAHSADSGLRGRVIAVWGPTGAPGRSTVAMGLGAVFADGGRSTLVVDADVYGGSSAVQLGVLDEASGLLAAARAANAGGLSPDALARHARTIAPELRVLTGLPRADRWPEVKAVLMGRIMQTATRIADVVVVDCGFSLERDEEVMYDTAAPRRNGATVEILERADLVMLVGSADPVGLSRLVRAHHELASVVPDVRPHILVNRVRASLGWNADEITATLHRGVGRVPISFLPDDQTAVDRCLVKGVTLLEGAPDSRLTRVLSELANQLAGPVVAARAAPSGARRRRRVRRGAAGVRRRRAARGR